MEISDILQRRGILDERQLLLAQQSANGHRLDRVVMDMGLASEEDLLKAFADELGMKYFELKDYQIDTQLLSQFPATPIFRHSLLPLQRENGRVLVASADPFDFEALDELSSLSGEVLEPVLALHEDVVDLIKQNLGVGGDTINELVSQKAAEDGVELLEEVSEEHGELADMAQTASVIRLVNELLVEALQQQASDVHIEPHETGLVVRYRVDGLLRVQSVPPEINHFYSAIITRLKIMAHLNIAEKRLPQDGRIKLRITGREIDVRVSIIPMIYGEGVVLRLLDKERMVFRLDNVGLNADMLSTFREMIELPHGIILVTGPTGSGKTSTLYSALNEIKSPETKIITVEDPVEYHSEGISQIQVNSRIGLTFAAGLRSILRHDPDVVLIGEIRDGETANSAIQASLTGHLVFSTLHTNDSPGAFTRLVDMGVEAYLVASTVEAVLAQRLVRVLCKHCKRPHQPHPDKIPPDFPLERMQEIYEPVGCRNCREMGYSGRIGILELLVNDPVIRKLCTEHASSGQIRDYARKNGWQTLRDAGWEKVLAGITSIDEILRVTKGDI
ncbi:Type II secretion system protein E [Gimesia chilikensis]|uniref:Type II secretion system protein E n=1 Tax=Gimesia chilikensis TaxID=2605989 RepID=A0A517WK15_9PLAN|nr:GspE/PulE family protein [Gimesia chilikensis]QDU05597.1 Type II secretion system protein E [Gimesia chilikensis]